MAQPSVLLLHGFPPENSGGIDAFERELRELLPEGSLSRATDYADAKAKVVDAEVVIAHRIDDDILNAGTNLRWIQALTSGYNRFDVDVLSERQITLTTVSGVHAEPIAQHVLGYALWFERGFDRARRQQRRGEWRRFAPGELTGKTVGIVGVGAIGSRVADVFDSFGVSVLGVKRDLDSVPQSVDEIFLPAELHSVLGRSDYVIAACPLSPETRGLFDARAFRSMGADALFINIARGGVVDQGALIEALQTGNLRGAAIDVVDEEPLSRDSPLWELENVLITPHMAGGSPHFVRRCAEIFETNYERYVAGALEEMENRVV